ncbi:MAG: hypothetical protein WC314_00980 [Vulcanimicrobiota bacterium]
MKTQITTSGVAGLALSALLFTGCSNTRDTQVGYDNDRPAAVQTQANTPILEGNSETTEAELADYDFSDATVAEVSNRQLYRWMNEVDIALQSTAESASPEQMENLAELNERAGELSEDLAAIDTEDLDQPADPDLVKDVMEVQVEVSEYAEQI